MDFFDIVETSALDLSFLEEAGISALPIAQTPLTGGANNRVFRLEFQNDPSLLLKSYFQHPDDARPRLQSEFEFLKFATAQGIDCVPKPLYKNTEKNLALYSYIDGSLATEADATDSFIAASVQFLKHLNRNKSQGKHLLFASESCSRVEDYFQAVEKRLSKLLAVSDPNLQDFIHATLLPQWNHLKNTQCKTALQALNPSPEDFILTPSDFGLHNTLVSKKHFYLDFEYAGWDDPVKTICDFFLQPKIPIPQRYFSFFAEAIASFSRNKEKTLERARQMFPVCKIKWCCIILNVFLDTEQARRRFAAVDLPLSKEKQLLFAKNYLFSTPTDQR